MTSSSSALAVQSAILVFGAGAGATSLAAGGVFVSDGGGVAEACAFNAEGGANLLAIALAFAFCAANCGRFVGWNRKEAVQDIQFTCE